MKILNAIEYSTFGNYIVWEVPITSERLFDFTKVQNSENLADVIASLILKYNIVYFVKLPINYHKLFDDVVSAWTSKVGDHAGMSEHRKER